MSWDFFISHSSEDKPLARQIALELTKRGKSVWFDEFELKAGDSLRRSIDYGLAHSRFGIVILSPHFFAKEWPNKELDALVARDDGSKKVIIPIWHLVQRHEVLRFSPTLADKLAIDSKLPTYEIVRQIFRAFDQECTDEILMKRSVLIIGGTGSGKTALSQKLMYRPLMYTVENGYVQRTNALISTKSGHACKIDYYILSYGDKSDEEFIESVAKLVSAVDVLLWVFLPHRYLSRMERELINNVLSAGYTYKPIIIALNQVDRIGKSWDYESWDEQKDCPTLEQQEEIEGLVDCYAKKLNISKEVIVPTSVDREYGIDKLRDLLLTL